MIEILENLSANTSTMETFQDLSRRVAGNWKPEELMKKAQDFNATAPEDEKNRKKLLWPFFYSFDCPYVTIYKIGTFQTEKIVRKDIIFYQLELLNRHSYISNNTSFSLTASANELARAFQETEKKIPPLRSKPRQPSEMIDLRENKIVIVKKTSSSGIFSRTTRKYFIVEEEIPINSIKSIQLEKLSDKYHAIIFLHT